MPPKDVKSILKEARESIKNQHYANALKLSRAALKEDKDNYMALVFLGISLQEVGPVEQAQSAFRKAIELNPTNSLAWSGLLGYYEKHDKKSENELCDVYCKLLELETNDRKVVEYAEKVSKICSDENCVSVCNVLYKLTVNERFPERVISDIQVCIASILIKCSASATELGDMFKEILKILIGNRQTVNKTYYGEYLKLLHKLGAHEELIVAAEDMNKLYEDDGLCLEWMCKVYNDSYIIDAILPTLDEKIVNYCEKLLNVQPNSSIGLLTKSILLFKDNKYSDVFSLLKKVVSEKPGLFLAWILLTKCSLKLYFYESAAEAGIKARNLLSSGNKSLGEKLDVLLAEVLTHCTDPNKLTEGIELCQKLLHDNPNQTDVLRHLIFALISSKNISKAEEYLSKLKQFKNEHLNYTLLRAKLLHQQNKLEEALKLLDEDKDCVEVAEWWLEIGDLYWDLGEYSESLVPYLKAAKFNADNYLHFTRLGRYYDKAGDLDKSRRCYEKALRMNDKDTEIVVELSQIYRKSKNWDANVILLQNYVAGGINSENSWACLQLGLNYVDQGNYSAAIESLRLVTRRNPTNSYYWDSLADAYLARGSYTSALRSYQKAAELSPESLYSQLQIATVKQVLGNSTEARKDFEEILSRNRSYVPALKGHADTCLHLAQHYKRVQMVGLARDCAQSALNSVMEAVKFQSNVSCLWKLLADGAFFIAKLPEKYSCALVFAPLLEGRDAEGNKAIDKDDLYGLAARCYCKALSLIKENALLWHDLAVCYYAHACDLSDSGEVRKMLEMSLAAAYHCGEANPGYWQHWNLIGNIYCKNEMKNYALAQHFYVKALTVERNSAVTWCNLGTLYLIVGELKLANKAFAEAQRSDPNYVNSWIGQALIAEKAGHEDAMDLFRHSTQLGAQQEGGVGYAFWVCKTLLKTPSHVKVYAIHNMHAVAVACDALTWYTETDPNDPCAWNMLGILQERMGLKRSAATSFRNAFLYSPKEHKDVTRINYARTLVKSGDYAKAIKLYSDIEAATFKSGSGLALALFKAGRYEEAYEAYESALHWLTEEQTHQSDLLVALASIAYMFQGPDAAKTLLFQSIQLKPPSAWGLYSTLALALRHNDLKLAKLTLNELEALKDKPECVQHYVPLLAYVYLLQEKHTEALKEVSKMVHRHPDHVSAWLTLFLVQLHGFDAIKPTRSALKCAKVARKLGNTATDVSKVLCFTALAAHLMGDGERALKTAQKALHCCPGIVESWSVFLMALCGVKREASRIEGVFEFVKREFNLSKCKLVESDEKGRSFALVYD